MEKHLLVQYNQTPEQHFFLCRQCRSHIALTQEYVFTDIMIEAGILNNVVNVKVDGEEKHRVDGKTTVADVYCLGCDKLLGHKFIAVQVENIILKKGRYLLKLNKLLMWNGTKMLYADTHEPVQNA